MWYNNGEWEGLRVDRVGHVLTQMWCALNEREAFVGKEETQLPVGNFVTRPEPWRLDNYRRSSIIPQIVEALRVHVGNLAQYVGTDYRFVNPVTCEPWVGMEYIAFGGQGDEWVDLYSGAHAEVKAYLQLRGVLEAMKLYKVSAYDVLSTAEWPYYKQSWGLYDTSQEAWDATTEDGGAPYYSIYRAIQFRGDTNKYYNSQYQKYSTTIVLWTPDSAGELHSIGLRFLGRLSGVAQTVPLTILHVASGVEVAFNPQSVDDMSTQVVTIPKEYFTVESGPLPNLKQVQIPWEQRVVSASPFPVMSGFSVSRLTAGFESTITGGANDARILYALRVGEELTYG